MLHISHDRPPFELAEQMNKQATCWLVTIAIGLVASPAFGQVSESRDRHLADCVAGQQFTINGSAIQVSMNPGDFTLGAESICRWITHSATTVSHFFGSFPVSNLQLILDPVAGRGVQGGTTYSDGSPNGGPLTTVRLGRDATQADLQGDWIMIHEMTHLAIPSVPRRSHWLEEGIATYIEPIARARRGDLSAIKIWGDMFEGMPKGLPQSGEQGLDRTRTWGRTYWGGALFCLLADVEIRRQTSNRASLDDALRGILRAGGNITQDWSIAEVLKTGDLATGTHVLAELYSTMGQKPGVSDLSNLWKRLGIVRSGKGVRFIDAEESAIRDAITATSTNHP